MGRYRLSEAAVQDFDRIYDYGIDEFGIEQATLYQHRLKERFADIAKAPLQYMAVEHIHSDYRRSVCVCIRFTTALILKRL